MIKDITFGQYLPFDSFVHKIDPRTKLLLTIGMIVITFVAFNFWSLLLLAAFLFVLAAASKVPLKFYWKSTKPILIFVAITAVLNIFYISGETLLVRFWIFNIYLEGITRAVFVATGIVLLIIISAALTYTTAPTALTDAIESLLSPLMKLGIDTHMFAMMMTIALRFIPTLIEETDKIMSAQMARGADMDSGNILQKIKAVIPILIPLMISSVRRAKELADAMESRCYHGGRGRTRMKQLHMGYRDAITYAASAGLLAGVILLNIFL